MTDVALQTTTSNASPERCPLRALMAFDFERLLDTFDEFVAALEVDDRVGALTTGHSLAARLGRRLELEEQLLLPAYAEARPIEAQLLRHDEQRLRIALRRLTGNLELHLLRSEHLRQFHKVLRCHSHRKDALYAWSELHLSPEVRSQILQLIHRPLGEDTTATPSAGSVLLAS